MIFVTGSSRCPGANSISTVVSAILIVVGLRFVELCGEGTVRSVEKPTRNNPRFGVRLRSNPYGAKFVVMEANRTIVRASAWLSTLLALDIHRARPFQANRASRNPIELFYYATRWRGRLPIFSNVAITRLGSPRSFHSTPVAGRNTKLYEKPARIPSKKLPARYLPKGS